MFGGGGSRVRAPRVLEACPVPMPTRDPATAGADAVSDKRGPNARGVRVWQRVRGCVCMSFPGSQRLARKRPHR